MYLKKNDQISVLLSLRSVAFFHQFWRQEMDAKQEEQARYMIKLREHANHLQQENERLRTHLETNRANNSKGPVHLTLLAQPNKGKELILNGESDPPAEDELSSDSSLLLPL